MISGNKYRAINMIIMEKAKEKIKSKRRLFFLKKKDKTTPITIKTPSNKVKNNEVVIP